MTLTGSLRCGLPLDLAFDIPAITRSRIISCSNSTNVDSMPALALPRVQKIQGFGKRNKSYPKSLSSFREVIKSAKLLPNLMSFHTRTTSTCRRRVNFNSSSRLGLVSAPEPNSWNSTVKVQPPIHDVVLHLFDLRWECLLSIVDTLAYIPTLRKSKLNNFPISVKKEMLIGALFG